MIFKLLKFCYSFLTSRKFRRNYSQFRFGFYKIKGKDNQIFVHGKKIPRFIKIKGLTVIIHGNNNIIKIGKQTIFENTTITLAYKASNADIHIGHNCIINNLVIHANWASNHKCYIGNNCILYGGLYTIAENNSCIKIGNDCLIANTVSLWAADGHSVIDRAQNKVINFPKKSLSIGDHCWIGHGCRLTKNASIPPHTICAAGAVVSKPFMEEYTIIGGNPAKILKRNVDWDVKPAFYKNMELIHEHK